MQAVYTKEDIQKILSIIDWRDTFSVDQASDFCNYVQIFYDLGKTMGMSPFIAKAALHELVDIACQE